MGPAFYHCRVSSVKPGDSPCGYDDKEIDLFCAQCARLDSFGRDAELAVSQAAVRESWAKRHPQPLE